MLNLSSVFNTYTKVHEEKEEEEEEEMKEEEKEKEEEVDCCHCFELCMHLHVFTDCMSFVNLSISSSSALWIFCAAFLSQLHTVCTFLCEM